MKKLSTIFLVFLLTVSGLALQVPGLDAARLYAGPAAQHNCKMTETATVNITFNSMETDVSLIKQKLDAKTKELIPLSKELGIKLTLQNLNYNAYVQNGGEYQVSGNANYGVSPASKLEALMVLLAKKGIKAGMSFNSYSSCQTPSEEPAD